jgi:hypothetical protein
VTCQNVLVRKNKRKNRGKMGECSFCHINKIKYILSDTVYLRYICGTEIIVSSLRSRLLDIT